MLWALDKRGVSRSGARSTSELRDIALPQLSTFFIVSERNYPPLFFFRSIFAHPEIGPPPTTQNLTMNQQNGGNLESRALLVQLAPFHFPKKKDYSYMLNAS